MVTSLYILFIITDKTILWQRKMQKPSSLRHEKKNYKTYYTAGTTLS